MSSQYYGTSSTSDDSVFVQHLPCDGCGSRDNNALYSDGRTYCFGCKAIVRPEGDLIRKLDAERTPKTSSFNPIHYEVVGLPKRALSEVTCKFFDYGIGEFNGQPCHLAHYRNPDTRELIAQKVRTANKDFPVLKEIGAKLPLFGQHLWRNDRRSIVITEGELDAMSVSQVQQNKYPVVSLSGGAGNAANDIKRQYEWLCEFDKIVLMFDDDAPGREAAEVCAELLPVGKVFIAEIEGYKDANAALVAGKASAITSAFWNAKPFQPDGIFTLSDIKEDVLSPVEMGTPWFLDTMTTYTFGRRAGEVYYFGAGCVDGRTEFLSPTGWKRIDHWVPTDRVSQYNDDGSLSFVTPDKFVKLPCPEMHEVQLKYGLSMALSPEHRVVHFSETSKKLSVTPFSEVMEQATTQVTGFRGLIRTAFHIGGSNIWEPSLLRLQVAVEADGSMHKNKVHIRIKRERKIERLLSLLADCRIAYSRWDHAGYSTISFTPPMRKGMLYATPFDSMGPKDLAVIAEEAPLWDGDGKYMFRTTIKQSADFVQFAMSSTGLRAAIGTSERPDKGHTEYRVAGNTRQYVSIRRASFTPMDEKYKYCFQVPTGMLVLRRDGRIFVTGNTGVGKTDFFTQQIAYDVMELGVPTACIYLEQPPAETGKRILGKIFGKQFHVPDGSWTQDELDKAFDTVEATGKLFLGGNFASASWEQIKTRIRFMAHGLGVKHIYLDHLTALADPQRERESLEIITKELALMAQELKVIIHVISHLATPDGKPHEEGGRVMLRHFKGSRAIGFWAHFAFGLERNPQHDDAEIAQQTTLRCLKDRYTGRATGKTITLSYDTNAGLISECLFPKTEEQANSSGGFEGQSLEV